MAFHGLNVNHRMQRTAALSQQVLERAKKRKLYWHLPPPHQIRTFQGDDDVSLEVAFAAVVEHLACISAACERYYCSVPPFQFGENEIEHIFRYHSREASQKLLRAFEEQEKKNAPIVEKQNVPGMEKQNVPGMEKQNVPGMEKQNVPGMEKQNVPGMEKPVCHKTEATALTEPTALIPAQPSKSEEILIEVSPGSYVINTTSYDDTIKEAHLVNVEPGESINLVLHLSPSKNNN
ncbi:A-kinase-interacting protein 1 [Erythrolamprus reginae]|uniref:A-kinase-interacting protein 1 n=1 Tax=Erythrolamprus reginae TaxID=121349 RepID=UPI00396CA4E7